MNPATMELAEALVLSAPERAALEAERFSPEEIAALLTAMKPDAATQLLRRLVPIIGSEALGRMAPEVAAKLVENLGPQRAVVILRRMDEATLARLNAVLPNEVSAVHKRMFDHGPDQAGGRLDPKAAAVSLDATVEHAHQAVRRAGDSALHYVYVVDGEHRLVGVVSLREMMLSEPATRVSTIMTRSPHHLHGDDPVSSVVVNPAWRRTHALPVVDRRDRFLGVIRYSEFRAIEAELGQTQSAPTGAKTAEALAELFWLGTSAMAKMTNAAILGGKGEEDPS